MDAQCVQYNILRHIESYVHWLLPVNMGKKNGKKLLPPCGISYTLNECGLATNQYLTNEIKMKIEALHHHHI